MPESRQPARTPPGTPRSELPDTPPFDFPDTELAKIAEMISGRRTAIVAGPTGSSGTGQAIAALAAAAEAIVIADPQAQIRFGDESARHVIHAADLLMASGTSPMPEPEAVLHVGAVHTSKPVNQWLQRLGAPVIQIHDSPWLDPLSIADNAFHADPAPLLGRLADAVEPGPADMLTAWRAADDAAQAALDQSLAGPSEPGIARRLLAALPAHAALVAASSMPIRLIDSYGSGRDRPLRVIANRGANGIDGSIATALGVAAAGIGPTYALLGDLSALADIGSLATASRLRIPITLVVINNDGGGIFEFLPQADPERVDPAAFEQLIIAPHGQPIAPVAIALGVAATAITDLDELEAIVSTPPAGPRLVEIATRRADGPEIRAAVISEVAAAAGLT